MSSEVTSLAEVEVYAVKKLYLVVEFWYGEGDIAGVFPDLTSLFRELFKHTKKTTNMEYYVYETGFGMYDVYQLGDSTCVVEIDKSGGWMVSIKSTDEHKLQYIREALIESCKEA